MDSPKQSKVCNRSWKWTRAVRTRAEAGARRKSSKVSAMLSESDGKRMVLTFTIFISLD